MRWRRTWIISVTWRCTQPCRTSSPHRRHDDKVVDWEKGWSSSQVFEGHAHYVMMCQWNPKDTNIFASCSLDRTIKVWGISGGNSSSLHFTLTGHTRGVNCVEYTPGGEKPYLISGSDDKTVCIWDYQTKQCVQTLTGHTNNVSVALFHPTLPIILTWR